MSSTKRVTKLFPAISSGNMATSLTGTETDVRFLDYGRYSIIWTGTSPVGTLTVEVQKTEEDEWETVDLGATPAVSGNTGSHEIVFNILPFAKIRPVYTRTSGTGTLDVIFIGKGV